MLQVIPWYFHDFHGIYLIFSISICILYMQSSQFAKKKQTNLAENQKKISMIPQILWNLLLASLQDTWHLTCDMCYVAHVGGEQYLQMFAP